MIDLRSLLVLLLFLPVCTPAGADTLIPASDDFFPLSDVKPGLEVTAYTVFEGDEIQSFPGRVKGVLKNYSAPGHDVILVQFEGDLIDSTGVAHGMSGSPVYVGDRLLGALALGFTPFPRDNVAGITPIQYMLEIPSKDEWSSQTANASPMLLAPSLKHLQTPVFFSGVQPEVLEHFRPEFVERRFLPLSGGSAAGDAEPTDAPDLLAPGSPVAVLLSQGDVEIAASGTVTYRNGNEVYAFGHPFLQRGAVELPMATASVVATLADQTYSVKLVEIGPVTGTLLWDRLPGVMGRIGPSPELMPVFVRVREDDGREAVYTSRLAHDPYIGDLILAIVISNGLLSRRGYCTDCDLIVKTILDLGPDMDPIEYTDRYSTAPDPKSVSPIAAASRAASLYSILSDNRFQNLRIESVEIEARSERPGSIWRLESAKLSDYEVRPGQEIAVEIVLSGDNGARHTTSLPITVPQGSTGEKLTLEITDYMGRERERLARGTPLKRARNLNELLSLLRDGSRHDRLYAKLYRSAPGLVVRDHDMMDLPPSTLSVLRAPQNQEPSVSLTKSMLWQQEIEIEGIVSGSRRLALRIIKEEKPAALGSK